MEKVYLIGNSHIDPVWLWKWQEGFSEILATWRSALDRLREFPELKFTSACAGYYEWVEKIDPDMFEEIRQRVKEGRWCLVGGWFLQPDCNIPCGETFARHGLLGQRYFKEAFGVTARTGYNVDSFGHNASLPQILKKSGMDHYVFMRPGPHEKDMKESIFVWEGRDGSRIHTFRIPMTYGITKKGVPEKLQEILRMAREEGRDYMAFVGIGNHGGGPTIGLLDKIRQLDMPELVFATPDEYFDQVNKEQLPVIADELQHHARGCYSACTFAKMNQRRCENNLLTAEKLCTMAKHLTGAKYPAAKLEKAWKNLLFNTFHDILGGCSIQKAYEDAGHLYGEILSITEQEIYFAMQAIARQIDTLEDETLPAYKEPRSWKIWEHEVLGTPVVVFNPHTWPVEKAVCVNERARKVTDEQGNEIPFQIVRGDQTNGAEDKFHTIFTAKLEPFGYAVYRFFLEKGEEQVFCGPKRLEEDVPVLENDRICVKFDRQTGDICSFFAKEKEQFILNESCSAVLLDETGADTWAHDLESLGELAGSFAEPEFVLWESGPVRTTMRVTTRYGASLLRRDYSIFPDSDEILVKVKVDFHEKHRTLKFAFPAKSDSVTAQIPYGTIERKKGLGEEPCGSWIASGTLGVANDGKYGYDTTEEQMRLTILRSAIYADHFGVRDEFCEYMEQGVHECSYLLFPYTGNCDAQRRADTLNGGLRTTMTHFHSGKLPQRQQLFACEEEHVVVTAMKQSADDEETVLRFCELEGLEKPVSMTVLDREIQISVSPHEIKTVRLDGQEVNLVEWPAEEKGIS